jgi:hypothetical protein
VLKNDFSKHVFEDQYPDQCTMDNFDFLLGGFNTVVQRGNTNEIQRAINALPRSYRRAIIHSAAMTAFNDGKNFEVASLLATAANLRLKKVAGGIAWKMTAH